MKKPLSSFFYIGLRKPLLPPGGRPARLLRLLGWLAAAFAPLYAYLMVEYFHFDSLLHLIQFVRTRGGAVLFGLSVWYLLALALTFLCRSLALSEGLTLLLSAVLGLVSHYKCGLTGDCFYPWDIVQTGNLGTLLGYLDLRLPPTFYLLLFGACLLIAVLCLSAVRLPLGWPIRLPALALLLLAVGTAVATPARVTRLLNRSGLYLEDMALQQSNYEVNGFTGAFAVNLLSSQVSVPDGYSEALVRETLAAYPAEEAAADFAAPDIVVILSESFWDPKQLTGTAFSENPTACFDEITSRPTAISGRMVQTGFGGGTVRPEFEVLTGLTTDYLPGGSVPWQYLSPDTESYVSLLKGLGYHTTALHPYTRQFYQRQYGYPHIGFDTLLFEDDLTALSAVPCERVGGSGYVTDATFEAYLEYYLSDTADAPQFLFGISMENHQPYGHKYADSTLTLVQNPYDAETADLVLGYAEGVRHADAALGKLVAFLDSRERPTVLVWFGDHLPTLGASYAAYAQSGTLTDPAHMTSEERETMQATPFLIYANFTLPHTSSLLHTGADNILSSYNLLNATFSLLGTPVTPLMAFLRDYAAHIPYYNVRLFRDVPEADRVYLTRHKLLTYDRVVGRRYSQP